LGAARRFLPASRKSFDQRRDRDSFPLHRREQQQPTLEQIAKFFNKPVGNVPGLNNSVMPWKIAKDGSVTNGLA
jgi:hypothetical protein